MVFTSGDESNSAGVSFTPGSEKRYLDPNKVAQVV